MKPLLLSAIVSAALTMVTCKKRDYPKEQEFIDEEIFRMEAVIDSEPVILKAGSGGYYCYSSYRQDAGGLYQFISELRKYNCTPCPQSLYLQINNSSTLPQGASAQVQSAIQPGPLDYSRGSDSSTTLSFIPNFNKAASAWLWDFGDGSTSDAEHCTHTFDRAGKYKVSLKATSPGGCNDVATSNLTVFENGGVFYAGVSSQTTGALSAKFNCAVTGQGPFTYSWFFGDGATALEKEPEHAYKWPGSYPVKLVVTDANGNTTESQYNYVTSDDRSSCAVNFSMNRTGAVHTALSKVKIKWTDKTNTLYSSDAIEQPGKSYFEIISVEDFDRNDAGDLTKLITVKMHVLLGNGSRSFWLTADKAVLAIAYK